MKRNPSKVARAIAIGYRKEDFAPRVLARGGCQEAETLCKIARSHGIPIVESPELAESLTDMKTFDYIPQKYWIIVAEILNLVQSTREKQ